MSTITTRAGKGSPLEHDEVDDNFTNLNNDKYESGDDVTFGSLTSNGIDDNASSTVMTIASSGKTTFTGDIVISEASPSITLDDADNADGELQIVQSTGNSFYRTRGATGNGAHIFQRNNGTDTLKIFQTNASGDVIFYENDGATSGLTWDASASKLTNFTSTGIDDNATATRLTVNNGFTEFDATNHYVKFNGSTDSTDIGTSSANSGYSYFVNNSPTAGTGNNGFALYDSGAVEIWASSDNAITGSLRINSSGVVTIPSAVLTTADINGGTVDGVTIGGSTAAAGTFTTFTSTGIDDNATSTAITIASAGATTFSGDVILEESTPSLKFKDSDVTDSLLNVVQAGGTVYFRSRGGTSAFGDVRFQRNNDGSTHLNVFRTTTGGDVLFYDDDGSTEGMRWDSSVSRVGIGISSPAKTIDMQSTAPSVRFRDTSATTTITDLLTSGTNGHLFNMVLDAGNAGTSPSFLIKNYTTEIFRFTGTGRLGIGEPSPDEELHIKASVPTIKLEDGDGTGINFRIFENSGQASLIAKDGTNFGNTIFRRDDGTNIYSVLNLTADGDVDFYDNIGSSIGMRWDASSERLGIDDTSPASLLQVGNDTNANADAYITFGKRLASTETNLPFIGHDDVDGGGHNDLGIGARSNNGTINFYTGNTTAFNAANRRMTIDENGQTSFFGGGVSLAKIGNIGPSSNSAIRISRSDSTVSTGNPLGYLEFGSNDATGSTDTAFAYVSAEAEGTFGAADNPTALAFGVTPDGSGTVAEAMRITNAGELHLYGGVIDLTDQEDPALSVSLESTGTLGNGGGGYASALTFDGQLQYRAMAHLFADDTTTSSGYPDAWYLINGGFSWGIGSDTIMSADGTDSVYEASAEHSFTVNSAERLRIASGGVEVHHTNGDSLTLVDTNLTASGSNIGNVRIAWDDSAGTRAAYVGPANSSDFFVNNQYGSVKLTSAGSTKLTTISAGINVTGSIGVNTTPARTLHVDSGSTQVTSIFESTGAGSFIDFANSTTAQGRTRIGADGTDTLTFTTATEERMRILSSGRIFMNEGPSATLGGFGTEPYGGMNVYPDAGFVVINADTTNSALYIAKTSAATAGYINFATSGTTRGAIVEEGSNIGIQFGGTATSAHTLDDYEEGTYTAKVFDASTGGNESATTRVGYYTKIGRVVTVNIYGFNNINTSGLTGSNNVFITLPLQSASTGRHLGQVLHHGFTYRSNTAYTQVMCKVPASSSRMQLAVTGYGQADTVVQVQDITSGADDIVDLSITYHV